MLALINVPEYISKVYSDSKEIAMEIYQGIKNSGKEEKIIGQTDLFKNFSDGTVIYIINGVFRFINDGKLMRLYSQSDFIVSSNIHNDTSLSSDFGTCISVFKKDVFLNILGKNGAILEKWMHLQNLENSINRFLSSAYMEHGNITPDFNLKEYKTGDLITVEGDIPFEIYEMISGAAVAIHENKEIGEINEGEIFGEISFLTESTRTATVKATKNCIVSIIKKDDFWDLIKYNPQIILSISKTLAKRIITLNDVVVGRII